MKLSQRMEYTLSPDKEFFPKILLTNDDGIDAPGFLALEKALSKVADVYVLAPDGNRSAVSNHIIMHKPLKLFPRGENRWASEGNPVDCVICALRSQLFSGIHFDAVVSGINKGANMGTDIVYSGTVSAARQAILYGYPGIAVSVESYDGSWKFEPLADFTAKNLKSLISLCTKEDFVNVNGASLDAYTGLSFASLCVRDYCDKVDIRTEIDGAVYSYFTGGNIQTAGGKDCDFAVVKEGKISISLIKAEPSCAELPEKINIADPAFLHL